MPREDSRGRMALGAAFGAVVLVCCAAAWRCRPPRSTMAVAIPFVARLAGRPFSCTVTAHGLGTKGNAFSPIDLALFVHGVELIRADGVSQPVALNDDGRWQAQGVALLDFEDGTGSCQNGTAGTHTAIEGSVLAGEYAALRFIVGVPYALNHGNPAVAEPPLNAGHMHWSWQGGYKFLRFEGAVDGGPGYRVHLGSTGCEGPIGAVSSCARPNRAVILLAGFQLDRSTVVLDLDTFLRGVDLGAAPADEVAGCMGGADDPDCAVPFAVLGLEPSDGQATRGQSAFSLS